MGSFLPVSILSGAGGAGGPAGCRPSLSPESARVFALTTGREIRKAMKNRTMKREQDTRASRSTLQASEMAAFFV